MTAVIVLVLASACMSGANPIAQKRAVGGVLMCTGANSTGQCNHAVHPMDKCVNVTTALYHKVVTFAPDGEEFYCYPYEYIIPARSGGCKRGRVRRLPLLTPVSVETSAAWASARRPRAARSAPSATSPRSRTTSRLWAGASRSARLSATKALHLRPLSVAGTGRALGGRGGGSWCIGLDGLMK